MGRRAAARRERLVLEERRDLHYLRRSGNVAVRRSRWRRGLLRRSTLVALQLGLIGGLYLIGRQAYLAAITSPHFDVKTIAVRGNRQAKTSDLVALAGSALSKNIFRVDMDTLRADVCRSPWVLDVSLRKIIPSTIEITVRERKPAAIVSFEGVPYLIDATGRRLAVYGPGLEAYDFPVLTGFENLPRPEASRRIRAGAAVVAALSAGRPEFARRISAIDLSRADRLAAQPSDGSPVLYLAAEDPLRNLDNYTSIRGLIPSALAPSGSGAEPPKIAYVDLRFRGRIAVMPQGEKDDAKRSNP